MPPTLPKTYERILSRVNESPLETQKLVQRTLMWVAYAKRPLSLAELAEILSVEEGDTQIDEEAIVDGTVIMASCSSLLRTSDLRDVHDESLVEFSHFTVKEFLLELDEASNAEFRKYSLASENTAQLQLAKMCLTYLSMKEFGLNFLDREAEEPHLKKKFPFRSYAARWIEHRGYGNDEVYTRLSRNLFNPSKSYNLMNWAQALASLYDIDLRVRDHFVDTSTLHWACVIADPSLCSYLIGLNENVNKSSTMGNPIHCTILGLNALEAAIILSDGDATAIDVMALVAGGDRANVIKILLAAGAKIDNLFPSQNSSQALDSFTVFSLTYQCCNWLYNPDALVYSALLQAGMICDKPTLEDALQDDECGFLEEIKPRNLKPEDTIWFISEYSKRMAQSAPAILTEIQENLSNDSRSLEMIQTLVLTAAECGQDAVVATLLGQCPIDVNEIWSSGGNTPLHLCVMANHPRTVELLLKSGADPLLCNADQKTSFHLATQHLDGLIFQTLLDVTTDIDRRDCDGITPLHEAACCGNTAVIRQLHKKLETTGFRQLRETSNGRSLSLCACQSGSVETLKLIGQVLGRDDVEKTSNDGSTAMHYAAEAISLSTIQYLLAEGLHADSSRVDESTPLHLVASAADTEGPDKKALLRLLLDHGASVGAQRADGATALFLLCEHGKMNSEPDLDPLLLLLETKSDIDAVDIHDRTPLHMLCHRLARWEQSWNSRSLFRTCIKAVCKFIEYGANVSIHDDQYQTPVQILFQAWRKQKPFLDRYSKFGEIWRVLLEHGGKNFVETLDLQGKRLLNSAIELGDQDLVNALLLIRCDVDKQDRTNGFDAIEQACLHNLPKNLLLGMLKVSKKSIIKDRAHIGLALLHFAALGGSENLVLTLLDHGADINEQTTIWYLDEIAPGATALTIAISKKHYHLVDVLLDRLASKTQVDQLGWTALHLGACRGNLELMIALQEERLPSKASNYFATIHTQISNLSPLHIAAAFGNHTIVNHILDAYPDSAIDQRTTCNYTALHLASWYGQTDTAKLLLTRKANVEATDNTRRTPLQLSIIGGHHATTLVLLDFGADIHRRTVDGLDLEMVALQNGHQDLADSMHKLIAEKTGN